MRHPGERPAVEQGLVADPAQEVDRPSRVAGTAADMTARSVIGIASVTSPSSGCRWP